MRREREAVDVNILAMSMWFVDLIEVILRVLGVLFCDFAMRTHDGRHSRLLFIEAGESMM